MIARKLTTATELLYGSQQKGRAVTSERLSYRSSTKQLQESTLSELTELLSQIYEQLPDESPKKKMVVEVNSLTAAAQAGGDKEAIAQAKDEAIEAIEYLKRHPGWP